MRRGMEMIMEEKDTELRDEGLRGNEKIEEAIAGLQQEPTQEMLAHALTVVAPPNERKRTAYRCSGASGWRRTAFTADRIKTSDGKLWWAAFTGFEEELRGSDRVKSTFLADMGQLFATALQADGVEGIILNPWNPDADAGKRADPDYFGAAGVKHLREAADMGRKCWTGGCRSRNYKG